MVTLMILAALMTIEIVIAVVIVEWMSWSWNRQLQGLWSLCRVNRRMEK